MIQHLNIDDELEEIIIPKSWETIGAASQLALLDTEADTPDLTEADREQLCQGVLGDLRRTFREICEQATRVRERVMADGLKGYPAIMARPLADDENSARAIATAALQDFFFHDGQDVKETTVYTGAIACSRETLGALLELNRRKDCFKKGMKRLRVLLTDHQARTEMEKIYSALLPEAPVNVSRKEAGAMVRNCIHRRLNIRQLERAVPVVPVCPDRIRWKHTIVPSTLRISRHALIEVLESRQNTDIQARFDLETVAGCADPEFQWKKGENEDCRIAVYCRSAVADNDEKWDIKNLSFKGRVPVFYLAPALAMYIPKPKPRKNASAKNRKPELVFQHDLDQRHERTGTTLKESFLMSMDVRRYRKYAESAGASVVQR
ncbi:hypothetical protein BTO32_15520 [Marinobacter lutaoensis]|uniref:Uncharacterized protein n=1 Tax=Marinobacter lutaoensis TaxID=135739 RepID=A0A1V2DPM9_9GAMM|nr:hypothetical protein [Marinobacter lutaoensis]ONF42613.1 hypothetical protein BTO32_15520 [Marinobacter lutaoensis]